MPVTEALWAEVMGGPAVSELPQVGVTWFEAIEFCNALSERDGLNPDYRGAGTYWIWDRDADGYRLPTRRSVSFLLPSSTEPNIGFRLARTAPPRP